MVTLLIQAGSVRACVEPNESPCGMQGKQVTTARQKWRKLRILTKYRSGISGFGEGSMRVRALERFFRAGLTRQDWEPERELLLSRKLDFHSLSTN